MIVGAEKRVFDMMPELDSRVVRTLLQADGRVVTAVLNAISQLQVQRVVVAALKRAGYQTQASKIESDMTAQARENISHSSSRSSTAMQINR